jgi:hypothetical protein
MPDSRAARTHGFVPGFYLGDPDGRRLEFTHDDRGVYWRE